MNSDCERGVKKRDGGDPMGWEWDGGEEDVVLGNKASRYGSVASDRVSAEAKASKDNGGWSTREGQPTVTSSIRRAK